MENTRIGSRALGKREVHWHGATNRTEMTHLAVQEKLEDEAAERMEQTEEGEYLR